MADTINVVIQAALNFAYNQNSQFFLGVNRGELELKMQEAFEAVVPDRLELDTTAPDFEGILLQVVQVLQNSDAWKDIIPSGTGMTLLRNIVAGISYAVFGNERALQESFVHIATSDTSIMEGTRALGVRPQRRIPSRVNCRFTRPDDGTILIVPPMSRFSIRDFDFFNRDQFVFNAFDVTLDVTLYQGTVFELEATAEGIPYERVEIGSENNKISDEDIYITISDEVWTRRTDAPFHFGKNEKCFYDDTLHNGNVEIQFGNGIFGMTPPIGETVRIQWAETEGVGANFPTFGLQVSQIDPQSGVDITGVTTSAIYAGNERLMPGFYRANAPYIRASNQRAVRRADYRTVAMNYPGVIDALFRGQAQLNPGRRNWMNIIGATILTDVVWGALEWTTFIEYMNKFDIYKCEFLRMDPIPVDTVISGVVYCRPSTDLNVVKSKLISDITAAFGPRNGSLGYSIYNSDVTDVLEGKDEYEEAVEYVRNVVPTDIVLDSPVKYVRITGVNLNMLYTTRSTPSLS